MRVDTQPDLAASLLAWYATHARALPWRATAPDPYRVWLSEIMLQQTTVAAVAPRFDAFIARWPTIAALAAAPDADVMQQWAGLGYYARARNLIATARIVAASGFPDDEAGLRTLPGVGRYTAAAIAAIAFARRAVVVDGNVERVVSRLFAVEAPLPGARAELYRLTDTITPDAGAGDFAQAMMDLGSRICTPRDPGCTSCPLSRGCGAYSLGDPSAYPRRAARAAKPERHAIAWWIERDGALLLVRRPVRGLLGGMHALPSSLHAPANDRVRDAALWQPATSGARLATIRHIFTHFTLSLDIHSADAGCTLPPDARWWSLNRLADAGLPTVFAKAVAAAGERR